MNKQVRDLVDKTWTKFQNYDASRRMLIAIAGIPGSGKTTLATHVVSELNILHHADFNARYPNSPKVDRLHSDPSQPDVAYVIPLDGYHLTRQQLSEMPNAEEATFRRGAAFTFDPASYLKLVEQLRQPLEAGMRTIHAPSFDHKLKDPIANDIAIPPTARIVVFEGLYTALDRPGWRDAAALMDEIWFVDVSIEIATARVAKRNFLAGISTSLEASLSRTRESDMRNGREVLAERLPVDQIVQSVEDEEWKSDEMKSFEDDAEADDGQEQMPRTVRMDSIAELAAVGGGC